MRVPRATYRLQLNGGFTFSDATRTVDYLAELGISDLYSSPYTRARPGSTHGYDVVDHNALNPEIGTPEDHLRLIDALHRYDLGHLLDIVPNHMGVGPENERWMSVLENGPTSPFARFFDVDWYPVNRRALFGKALLPVLGDHYRAVLEGGELTLRFDAKEGSFAVYYYEHRFPVDPRTYPLILSGLPEPNDNRSLLELESLVTAFGKLPDRDETAEERVAERERDAAIHKGRLARLCADAPEAARAVADRVRRTGGEAGRPESFERLHRLLEEQAYRLVYWRVASDEINYRRFFSINDLAGIRTEDERVFRATHELVVDLVREGKVDGLRIDHPDGLYDPAGYFRRLGSEAAGALGASGDGPAIYVVAEKILAAHEDLPEDWPVAGTTGYDFANLLGGLFVDAAGEGGMDRAYRRFLEGGPDFKEILYASKKLIMRNSLASELNVLSRRLLGISEYGRRSFDFTINVLRDALSEVIAAFPVYRTYITAGYVSEQDRRYVGWAVARAKKRSAAADTTVFDFVRDVLLMEIEGTEEYRAMVAAFVMKFQQYTGPVMAKGMEDTALYRYNRLTSLNEVGGEPERFGVSVSAFHHVTAERAKRWPHAMLATSTHDTKRGEDTRARISVLSEIPNEWRANLVRWARANRSRRRQTESGPAPSRNDEYLLYQTLLGAWPLGEMDEAGLAEFRERIQSYMEKAVREAQLRTSWINVNEEYERAVAHFVEALLAPGASLFLDEFTPFARRIARLGALNSLSQTLVKLTAPGVPDIYQGNELWDPSLVDPDNRRPIDYALRRRLLAELRRMDPAGARTLLEAGAWQDGRPKLYLTWRALELRRERPELFTGGEYIPLEVEGELADHVVAFARGGSGEAAVTVAPRLYSRLAEDSGGLALDPEVFGDTRVSTERVPGGEYRNVLAGRTVAFGGGEVAVRELLGGFPVALLGPVR